MISVACCVVKDGECTINFKEELVFIGESDGMWLEAVRWTLMQASQAGWSSISCILANKLLVNKLNKMDNAASCHDVVVQDIFVCVVSVVSYLYLLLAFYSRVVKGYHNVVGEGIQYGPVEKIVVGEGVNPELATAQQNNAIVVYSPPIAAARQTLKSKRQATRDVRPKKQIRLQKSCPFDIDFGITVSGKRRAGPRVAGYGMLQAGLAASVARGCWAGGWRGARTQDWRLARRAAQGWKLVRRAVAGWGLVRRTRAHGRDSVGPGAEARPRVAQDGRVHANKGARGGACRQRLARTGARADALLDACRCVREARCSLVARRAGRGL
ncbi:ADP/ATP translocase [Striga asiatica]|uniref:ADP/ATP translocase n=1 Tax=Striga asiatica TaxID=4170 RepID=A0A5A7PMW9_STRAF|nr:ADP/ATP translocase [Striga asiatica]